MSYQVTCIKCKTPFVSEDNADFDGEGFCEPCKILNKEVAKRVDEQIAARRANKPRVEVVNPYAEIRKKRKGAITYFNRGVML